jgi:hypothetical protein
MATLTFSSLHATDIRFSESKGHALTETNNRKNIRILLRAPLGVDPVRPDSGWVELTSPNGVKSRLMVIETGDDTGVFSASFKPEKPGTWKASYGYWGFRKEAVIQVKE